MNSIFIVLPILAVLMFDLGLTLAPKDFAVFARRPRPVLVGLFGQLVVLPLVAFAVGSMFRLSPVFLVGIVLIACCPGGSSSNIFSKLAGGDVSLSVTLTALSSLITLITIPLILQIATSSNDISLPIGQLLVQNLVMMLLPILLGMALRHWRPAAAAKTDRILARCAFPALIFLASVFFLQHRLTIADNIAVLGLSVFTLLVVSILCGALLSVLFRLKSAQRRTIVIEVGMQNAAQAIAIAASPFVLGNSVYAIPAIIYALLMNVVLLVYVAVVRNSRKSGGRKLLVFKSSLHDQTSVLACRGKMISKLQEMGVEIVDAAEKPAIGKADKVVCFVGTGGTEEIFRENFASLLSPIVLLSDGYHNSFAASFEIATFLSQRSVAHRLVNIPLDCKDFSFIADLFEDGGATTEDVTYDALAAEELYQKPKVAEKLRRSVIGLIGGTSSWLISSDVDTEFITAQTGARFVRIPIEEVIEVYCGLRASEAVEPNAAETSSLDGTTAQDLKDATIMYRALDYICKKYHLTALTLKCFDLLGPCKTTACYALANLNDHGIISGCEGDIPTLWTMIVASAITGDAPFMANPSSSDRAAGTVDFAHCTIPLKMVTSYKLPSHFESNIGIGIAGQLPEGEYRIFKIGGARLNKIFTCEGRIICNTHIKERCRTQVRFQFPSAADYDHFIQNRTGNHIILMKKS